MEYIKIRFGDDTDQIGSRFEKTIEDMFRSMSPMFAMSERSWKPPIDIYETDRHILIIAEVAGVEKEDLEIEINAKAVKIFGVRKEPKRLDNARFRLAEIQYGKFERILFLPSLIDPDKVTASHENGFLRVELTKKPLEKPLRIPIADG